jgi:hypothetical protein
MSDEPVKSESTAAEEPVTNDEPRAESAETQQKPGSADDFRDALSNLSAALDRFGRATEARARQEWREGKPEIQRAVDEMKRGVEGLIRKSSGAVDSISRRLNRDEASATPPPAPTTEAAAENAAEATAESGTIPSTPEPETKE